MEVICCVYRARCTQDTLDYTQQQSPDNPERSKT
jgi:hypothetical protein